MDKPTPEHLRQAAVRCHALSPRLASPADRTALDDYADVLDQQARDLARDLERELPAEPAPRRFTR